MVLNIPRRLANSDLGLTLTAYQTRYTDKLQEAAGILHQNDVRIVPTYGDEVLFQRSASTSDATHVGQGASWKIPVAVSGRNYASAIGDMTGRSLTAIALSYCQSIFGSDGGAAGRIHSIWAAETHRNRLYLETLIVVNFDEHATRPTIRQRISDKYDWLALQQIQGQHEQSNSVDYGDFLKAIVANVGGSERQDSGHKTDEQDRAEEEEAPATARRSSRSKKSHDYREVNRKGLSKE